MSAGVYSRTNTPRRGWCTTSPSASSRRSASRTGCRLMPRLLASSSWMSFSPGRRRPSRIALRMWRATSSRNDVISSSGSGSNTCISSTVRRGIVLRQPLAGPHPYRAGLLLHRLPHHQGDVVPDQLLPGLERLDEHADAHHRRPELAHEIHEPPGRAAGFHEVVDDEHPGSGSDGPPGEGHGFDAAGGA